MNLIKNYEKPSIVKETNALYLRYLYLTICPLSTKFQIYCFLSLIDAAVNGPNRLNIKEAERVLGKRIRNKSNANYTFSSYFVLGITRASVHKVKKLNLMLPFLDANSGKDYRKKVNS